MNELEWISLLGYDHEDVFLSVPNKDVRMSRAISLAHELNPECLFDAQLTRMYRMIAKLKGQLEDADRGLAFRRTTPSEGKKDLLLSWASGTNPSFYKYMRVFVASANEQMPEVEKVVLTHDMPLEYREFLQDEGFQVWDIDPHGVECLIRDRCFKFHDFLTQFGHRYKRVLIADSKDVVFQGNIFDHYGWNWSVPKQKDTYFEFALVFSEGTLHRQSPWNQNDQLLYQKAVSAPHICYGPWEVINGGLMFGHPKAIGDLCLKVGEATLKAHQNSQGEPLCSDQAALNYLYRHDLYSGDQPLLIEPGIEGIVAHGDAIKEGTFEVDVLWNEHKGFLEEDYGDKFLIFHQWDRTEYHDLILAKYGIDS